MTKALRPAGRAVARAACALLILWPCAGLAQTVRRGPYLQSGTPQSVVVRWRTDVPTASRVRYGAAPGSLTSAVDDPAVTTEHVVSLSGLSAGTRYYYSVGTPAAELAGNDLQTLFFTSPAPGTSRPTRIWVVGDSGTANANAAAVRTAYENFTGARHTDLWLMLGDNAYPDGTDPEYQAAVFDMYPALLRKSVLWPTLGNHDGHTADSAAQTGPYYDIFTLPENGQAGGLASGTEAYYSFDFGNVHFICLESYETPRSPSGAMMTWLASDIASTAREWVIAFWHHPPYTRGSHNSDTETELREMRENALPILEAAGVDLVLTGHSHSYERSFLLDGHYGTASSLLPSMKKDPGGGRENETGAYRKPAGGASHAGAVYVVAGSAGQTGGGPLNHPAMFISLDSLGSLVLDVDGKRLDAMFLRSDGTTQDSFTIQKGRRLHTVAPCRLFDTRSAAGPRGGPALAANSDRTFPIAGSCNVPASARAISGNLTVTQSSGAGDLRAYPGGRALPLVSTLNFGRGQTRANNLIAELGAAGDLAIRCTMGSGQSVHAILDVTGYLD